jgi:ribonuclease R
MIGRGGRHGPPDASEIVVIERCGSDRDGIPLARVVEDGRTSLRTVRIVETGGEEPAIGRRAVARVEARESGGFEARIIRLLDPPGRRVVGVYNKARDGGTLSPADRRDRTEYRVEARDAAAAEDRELVVGEPLSTQRFGLPRARIVARLGRATDPGAISRITIAAADIPTEFPPAAIAEADAASAVGPQGRADLRPLALVTIDGGDARDFDDAVWAEPDPDPANRGGFHLVVAIADVAAYVPPGGALDREALRRGNSVYFPDRVVPMLPAALSNELCSLKPKEDRACVAIHLWIDPGGRKRRHRFERAIMRSAARFTYEEVQAVADVSGPAAGPGPQAVVAPLYAAFAALARARAARGALELDIAEDRVVLDADNRPAAIVPMVRLDSHRLIEEFMILANVAAAEELELRRRQHLYRVHDAPDPERLDELRRLLDRLGLPGLDLARGQAPKPELFNRLLRRAEASPVAATVNDAVLRAQAQAAYSPDNIGHYGLALPRYVHFTSPIRRYADLLVHRALVGTASGAPERGIDHARLAAIGAHLSATERRAAAAEREAADRYRAALLAPMIGRSFEARISGVAAAGLFVTTGENRAVGLVPMSSLPGDRRVLDREAVRRRGASGGPIFRIGDVVPVRLVEADAASGRLVFRIDAATQTASRDAGRGRHRGRRPNVGPRHG